MSGIAFTVKKVELYDEVTHQNVSILLILLIDIAQITIRIII